MKSQEMYIIVFGIFIVKLQTSVSEPEFPPHIDLQKVGEAIFNNEKFNILKPTTHRVTDHFKDFMLRTESYHPAKRVFIDHNGFRHDWSGFGEKSKSLRKTDLKHLKGSFEIASENIPKSDIISKDDNNNTATVKDRSDNNVSSIENEHKVENNASENNNTVHNVTKENTKAPESREMTTIINLFPTIQKKNNSSTKITIEESLRQGYDDAKDTKLAPASKEDGKKKGKRTGSHDKAKKHNKHIHEKKDEKETDEKEKTVATTTFFCPYFGTITMSAFID